MLYSEFRTKTLQRMEKKTNRRSQGKTCQFDIVDTLEAALNTGDARVLITQAGHTDWVEPQIRSILNSL